MKYIILIPLLIILGAGCEEPSRIKAVNSGLVDTRIIERQQNEINQLKTQIDILKQENPTQTNNITIQEIRDPKATKVNNNDKNQKTDIIKDPPTNKPSMNANPIQTPQPITTNQPTPPILQPTIPTQAPNAENQNFIICNNLKSEWTAYSKKVLQMSSESTHLIGSLTEILNAYDISISYAYDTAVARRTSFYSQADALVKTSEELPILEFGTEVATNLASKYYFAAQDYKNAYDLQTEAFNQGSYGGLGIDFMKDRLRQASDKTKSALTNSKAANQDALTLSKMYETELNSKNCSK